LVYIYLHITLSNTTGGRSIRELRARAYEASKMSLDEIEAKVLDYFDIFYNVDKNDIDVDLLAMAVKRKLGVRLGHNKTYRLKKQIMFDHPKLFEEAPAENVNTIK